MPSIGNLGQCETKLSIAGTAGQILGTVQISDVTVDGLYSFGSFPASPGLFNVRYCGGAYNQASGGYWTMNCGQICYNQDFDDFGGSITHWNDITAYPAGLSLYSPGYGPLGNVSNGGMVGGVGFYRSITSVLNYGFNDYGGGSVDTPYWHFLGRIYEYPYYSPCNSYNIGDPVGDFLLYGWECTNPVIPHAPGCGEQWVHIFNPIPYSNYSFTSLADAEQTAACASTPFFCHSGGSIGIAFNKQSGAVNSALNPRAQLIYNPLLISMLEPVGCAPVQTTGYGHWSTSFSINNLANIAWPVTVTLLSSGGISNVSAAGTVTLAAKATTSSQTFTFDADPRNNFITATLQISICGIVVGTLTYPTFPIVTVSPGVLTGFSTTLSGGIKVYRFQIPVDSNWLVGGHFLSNAIRLVCSAAGTPGNLIYDYTYLAGPTATNAQFGTAISPGYDQKFNFIFYVAGSSSAYVATITVQPYLDSYSGPTSQALPQLAFQLNVPYP
jgi:hypothetical protein